MPVATSLLPARPQAGPARGRRPGAKGAATGDGRDPATLDRALSKLGLASRSQGRDLVRAGRVRVNGTVVDDPDRWVDLAHDRLSVDGDFVRAKAPVVLAMNKPRGVVTTRADEHGRATVYERLDGVDGWVFSVGRLDKDTAGLLLFTNDTALAEALTNPATHVPKSYAVKVRGRLDEQALERLRTGIELDGRPTRPAEVVLGRATEEGCWLEITIVEGRNRQVRRMIEAVSGRVEQLVRIRFGPVALGALEKGAVRKLGAAEVSALRAAVRGAAHRLHEGSGPRLGPRRRTPRS